MLVLKGKGVGEHSREEMINERAHHTTWPEQLFKRKVSSKNAKNKFVGAYMKN